MKGTLIIYLHIITKNFRKERLDKPPYQAHKKIYLMYFINKEIKPRLSDLKQFTSYCHPKIASMASRQVGQGMADCQAARLPGRAWQAA